LSTSLWFGAAKVPSLFCDFRSNLFSLKLIDIKPPL
jgi:hypothetical protein